MESGLNTKGDATAMNRSNSPQRLTAVVAGHICLDIIPDMSFLPNRSTDLFAPGLLHQVGKATLATGGVVSNTGIALLRLGIETRLMGKVGADPFGGIICSLLRELDPKMAEGMIVDPASDTSYSIVVSPPATDRIFFHHCGANDTYVADDVPVTALRGVRLFHFGYPPLMKQMYRDGGRQLQTLFKSAKSAGCTTSLDMTHVDGNSEAARVDWRALLANVLPKVDLFLPSLDEICFMLGHDPAEISDVAALESIAGELLAMGSAVVAIKLGDQGLFLRTSNASRLNAAGAALPADRSAWTDRQLLASCFAVEVAGTTGAGDTTIAGFLAAMLRGLSPAACLNAAAGVGACCVERADAVSGVCDWEALQRRIASGWLKRPSRFASESNVTELDHQIFAGPLDQLKRTATP